MRSHGKISVCLSCLGFLVALCAACLIYFWCSSEFKKNPRGAVVSNGEFCAAIGRKIIEEGGSAADSIISVLICEGVVLPHMVGIGGGFMATIYNRKEKTFDCLIAKETAPAASTTFMFQNESSIDGALAVSVPGELKGYWELHKKYGKLPWKRLFEPSIELCVKGTPVSEYMAYAMTTIGNKYEPTLKEMLIDPKTNDFKTVGSLIFRPVLAKTLTTIAEKGADAFYNGDIGEDLVKDLRDRGGILTEEDLANYKVRWEDPIRAEFLSNYYIYSTPVPGGGCVLVMILNLIGKSITEDYKLLFHRLVESFKHAFGHRGSLGDLRFQPNVTEVFRNMTDRKFADLIRPFIKDDKTFDDLSYYGARHAGPQDHGTSSMSVLHPNGDAISVTSSVNYYFGSKIRSPRTGIILNDNMDDFSNPDLRNTDSILSSPYNFIEPGKMSLSSMSPSIIVNREGDVVMTIGSAGGQQIITAISQVLLNCFYLNHSLDTAVEALRLHHQLLPKVINYEEGFDPKVLEYLKERGHVVEPFGNKTHAAVSAILVKNDTLEAVYDKRRGGSASVFN